MAASTTGHKVITVNERISVGIGGTLYRSITEKKLKTRRPPLPDAQSHLTLIQWQKFVLELLANL